MNKSNNRIRKSFIELIYTRRNLGKYHETTNFKNPKTILRPVSFSLWSKNTCHFPMLALPNIKYTWRLKYITNRPNIILVVVLVFAAPVPHLTVFTSIYKFPPSPFQSGRNTHTYIHNVIYNILPITRSETTLIKKELDIFCQMIKLRRDCYPPRNLKFLFISSGLKSDIYEITWFEENKRWTVR